MNRNPGAGKTDYGGSRNIIIIDEHGTLYGFKTLKRIQEQSDGEDCYVVNCHVDMFIAFMQHRFGTHWAIKALVESEEVTPEILEDLSDEITLTYTDARQLEYWIERMRQDPDAPNPDSPEPKSY